MCSRWADTSRSEILTAGEMSRAEHGPSSSAAMIAFLVVSWASAGTAGSFAFSFVMDQETPLSLRKAA